VIDVGHIVVGDIDVGDIVVGVPHTTASGIKMTIDKHQIIPGLVLEIINHEDNRRVAKIYCSGEIHFYNVKLLKKL